MDIVQAFYSLPWKLIPARKYDRCAVEITMSSEKYLAMTTASDTGVKFS